MNDVINSYRCKTAQSIIHMHGCHVSSSHGATIAPPPKTRIGCKFATPPCQKPLAKESKVTSLDENLTHSSIHLLKRWKAKGNGRLAKQPTESRSEMKNTETKFQLTFGFRFSHVVHLVELRPQGSLEVKFILEMAFFMQNLCLCGRVRM